MNSNVSNVHVIATLTSAFGPPRTYPLFVAWSFGPVPPPGRRPLNLWVPLVQRGGVSEAWIFPRDGSDMIVRERTDLRTERDISELITHVRAASAGHIATHDGPAEPGADRR